MSATAETPPPPAPAAETCPSCGAPLPPEQEWCLQCGAPARTHVARTPAWRIPIALLAAAVILLGAAVAVAFVQLSDDSRNVGAGQTIASTPATTPTATTPATTPTFPGATTTTTTPATTTPTDTVPTTPATTTPGATTPSTTTPSTPHQPGSSTPPASSSTGTVGSWPSGKTAYTAVLMSATSRSAAKAKATQFADQGIDVGILRSNDFSSLEPGYWVVFSGTYPGLAPAEAAARRLSHQGAPGAYGRLVKP